MANGETCGIKVGVQGATRGSISNSKLREVKQIIQQNEAKRRKEGDNGPRFSPVVKPGPRPRIPRVDQAATQNGQKRTNLLQRFSANQVVGSVKVKTPQGKPKPEKKVRFIDFCFLDCTLYIYVYRQRWKRRRAKLQLKRI